ncbi:MAG: trypsin-like peptidase domain-containing protein [Candidatus Kapabacteria bacterium]|nr:trypsin-like peptidase domain-containing protein [Candidatus Kapabacteria bacterium]
MKTTCKIFTITTILFSLYIQSALCQSDYSQEGINNSRQSAITRAIARATGAIVGINVTETYKVEYRDPFNDFFDNSPFMNDPQFRQYFQQFHKPQVQEYDVKSLGSGYIVSPDGYILTNHHVAGNASKVIITMTNGEKFDAEIIGSDMVSDVALLKIKGDNFPYLLLGNSDDILIGEWAIALGNPFGLFNINAKPTVTVGVVSNSGVNFMQENRIYRGMIQTDAAISSGNSGGPLLNSAGEVIGMNTVIFSTAQSQQGAGSIGIGFAIPVNRVRMIMEKLKAHKKIERNPQVGLKVAEIDDRVSKNFKIPKRDGVIVVSVLRGSQAEKAGIEPGDIILEIDDLKIMRNDDYLISIGDALLGQKINMIILRDDKKIKLQLMVKSTKEK